jgi:hypothetical protein
MGSPFKPVKKYCTFSPPSWKGIPSLTLGSELSCLLSLNMTYRVLLLQGGEIYYNILLIPEMSKETFFKGLMPIQFISKNQKIQLVALSL